MRSMTICNVHLINYNFLVHNVGATLTVQTTMNVSEFSNMTRDLCVELSDVAGRLERAIHVTLDFVGTGYAMICKLLWLIVLHYILHPLQLIL